MTEKDEFLKSGLLDSYVLGITSPEQSAIVERMLSKYPELHSLKNEMQNGVEKYCAEKYKSKLPKDIDDRLANFIDRIDAPEKKSENKELIRWKRYTQLAAGLALLFGAMLFISQAKKNNLERLLMASNVDKERITESYRDLVIEDEELRDRLAFINHNLTNQVEAKGTKLAPKSCAKIHWNPTTKSIMISNVEMLPEAPPGKEYHFWVDVNGEMLHVGSLQESLERILEKEIFSSSTSINLTLEEKNPEEPNVDALIMVGNF